VRQALAWQLQMQALQSQSGVREARRGKHALKQAAIAAPTLSPGTRPLREWQGRTHHVTVVAEGFAYDNRLWPSLSSIARAITGTRWSGPAFFGLRSWTTPVRQGRRPGGGQPFSRGQSVSSPGQYGDFGGYSALRLHRDPSSARR